MKLVTTGRSKPPRELGDLVLYAVAARLDIHHQHRAGGVTQAGDDLDRHIRRVRPNAAGLGGRGCTAPTSVPTRSRGSSI